MEDIKDGGQAFPTGSPAHGGSEGMSLRDWFAGQALIGLMSSQWHENSPTNEATVEWCYKVADLMLESRQPKG